MSLGGPLTWQLGEVIELKQETTQVATLVLQVSDWPGHLAGQHVDVRLTAEDGYEAQRSYSIASAPQVAAGRGNARGEARVAITVERLDDGEVSPYLVGEARVGDRVEVRGPIGGYFVWKAQDRRPLLLVAGGSGVVPLMAMLRHRSSATEKAPARMLYSSRTIDDVIYREELEQLEESRDGLSVVHTLTREQPDGWKGYGRRIDRAMMREVAWPAAQSPVVFICGPTAFVETAADLLVESGYMPAWIKTERFGATGG
ncbi:MAG: ferredoxin reductase [Candidatus Dormibacteraceae bacterium]